MSLASSPLHLPGENPGPDASNAWSAVCGQPTDAHTVCCALRRLLSHSFRPSLLPRVPRLPRSLWVSAAVHNALS